MTLWSFIILLSLIAASVGVGLNIRSLIRKWKANPTSWLDILPGILISCIFIGALVYIFIQYVL